MRKKLFILLGGVFVLGLISAPAMADQECISAPAIPGFYSLDNEFGEGTHEITRCLTKTGKIKLVLQINKACRDTTIVNGALENHARSCNPGNPGNPYAYGRGYGIAQAKAMINDYTIANGIKPGNLDINLIVHGGGGTMLLNNAKHPVSGNPLPFAVNKLQGDVEYLISQGVKFHFCMNTVRGMAKKINAAIHAQNPGAPLFKSANLVKLVIPGVTYVTGGMTALQDFQDLGYTYIQP